ncbi:integrator complex subunit 7 [Quercus suber]|uniref:Integrator complex subunit 7 n=1 Tax=Quercus suber TaxID=58331 RepID=A0AAW0L2Q0_QUESU
MERNSTARAMEWSIELEKALRSKKPGQPVEAILQIGPRLEHWSREPEPSMAVYDMFGLVPGEDRLFANTILLRLADAFRLGDKHTKLAIVRIFLSEYRNHDKKNKSKGKKGILSKARPHNHLELLTRVKDVFDTGEVESRALALALFGCWADFAKDSAQIRYVILSSLVSSHVLEVKASLFAAGCFSELSDDFACTVLEMLVNMLTLSETSPAVRLAGARVLAKIGCSYSVTNRAYQQTGLKLVLDSTEEDFLVALLVSLSKLSFKSTVLISEQVDLLSSFLRGEKTTRMKATVLRCLHFLLIKGPCHFPVSADLVKALFSTLNDPELPTNMQCEALQILHKILPYMSPQLPCLDTPEFTKLLTIAEDFSQSPIALNGFFFIHVLADISRKLGGKMEMESGMFGSSLLSRVISLVIDQMTLLVKPLVDLCQIDSKVFQRVCSLLNLLLLLVGEHPDQGAFVLDKIYLFIEYVVNMHDHVMATRHSNRLGPELDLPREKSRVIRSKLVLAVCRFIVACLETLNEAGTATTIVFEKVKLLVEHVCQCSLFDCYIHTILSLLFHCKIIWGFLVNESKETCDLNRNSVNYHLIEKEVLTLECANKMLKERYNWPAYRAGMYAACQGAWFTATFIFQQLTTKVQSDICYSWLKSIIQLAHSERKIQLLLLPKQGSTLVEWLEKNKFPVSDDIGEISRDTTGRSSEPNYSEELLGAYRGICSAGETLERAVSSGQEFCFQRWFLYLRAKLLRTLVDLLRIHATIQFSLDRISNNGDVEFLKSFAEFIQISLQFRKLAKEFDLIATSSLGIDSQSSIVISSLALSCSLLAFSTGFILFVPNLAAYETVTSCGVENSEYCSRAMLIQNLVGRLWHIDHETSRNLCQILYVSAQLKNCLHASGQLKNCFDLQSRNKLLKFGCEEKDILTLCSYAVSGVVGLQEANRERNEDMLPEVIKDGLQLLLNIIMKWIQIPFRTPKYLFKVRPCIGSKLFAHNSDTKSSDRISILPGFLLSLNLCLQLNNLPPDLPARLTKLYCILYCRVSFQEHRPSEEDKEQMQWGCRAWENDDIVEINEMLFRYVTNLHTKRINNSKRRKYDNNEDGVVYAFVHFEPNESGQGFASCLLDISSFPVGSYRIKWHSCCIDDEGSYWSLLPLNAGPVVTVSR